MATSKTREARKLSEDAMPREQQAFRRKQAQLLQRYEGKYVALYRGRVVGHAADDEELALRMFRKLGDVPFHIARVEKEPTVYELPSPETIS